MSATTHKLVVAIEYLDTAATLWVHGLNYFSAMHLAAAAEEIAGKACRIRRKNSYFDDLRARVRQTLSQIRVVHTDRQLKDAFYGAKNAIKHMASENDAMVTIDPKREAADYIVAAYRNFAKLGLENDLSKSVKEVVEVNALLVETSI